MVEVKTPGTPLDDAREQGESYAFVLRTPVLLVTDGLRLHIWQVQQTGESLLILDITEAEFNPQFRESYREAAAPLPKALEAFNQAVADLAEVQRKVDAPLKAVEPTPLAEGLAQLIIDAIETINAILDENNQLAANFAKARKEASNRVR